MITCNTSNLNNIDKATPTNYQLIFPLIPSENSIGANNPFVMNIFSAMLPSVSIATEEMRWQGNKSRYGLIPMEFDPWLVSFVVDSRLANWKLLFDWMNYINNNKDKIAEYHKQYSVDCSLVVVDNYSNVILEVIFIGIWPGQLGEVSFSQREGDVILESTVNFNYDYFYIRNTTTWPIEFSSSSSSTSSSSTSSSSSSSSSSSISSSSSSLSSSSSYSSFAIAPVFRWDEFEKSNNIRISEFGKTAKSKNADVNSTAKTILGNSIGINTGKVYYEIKNSNNLSINGGVFGFCKKITNINDYDYDFTLGQTNIGIGFSIIGANVIAYFDGVNIKNITFSDSVSLGDIIGLAANIDEGRFWISYNGTWYPDSPVSGSGVYILQLVNQTLYPAITPKDISSVPPIEYETNSGILEFEYPIPNGYSAFQAPVMEERNYIHALNDPKANSMALTNTGLQLIQISNIGPGAVILDMIPKSSGKWYYEVEFEYAANDNLEIGWSSITSPLSSEMNVRAAGAVGDVGASWANYSPRDVWHNGSQYVNYYGVSLNSTSERYVILCAIDIDRGKIWWGADWRSASGIRPFLGYQIWWSDGSNQFSGNPETDAGGIVFPAMAGVHLIPWIYMSGGSNDMKAYIRVKSYELRYSPPTGFLPIDGDYETEWDENNKSSLITISTSGTRAIKTVDDGNNHGIFGKMAKGEARKYIEMVLNESQDTLYLRFGLMTDSITNIENISYYDIRRSALLFSQSNRIIWGPGYNDYEYYITPWPDVANTVYGFAIDFRSGNVWVSRNGSYLGGGDPETDDTPTLTWDKIYKVKPFVGNRGTFDVTLRTKDEEFEYKPNTFTEW